MHHGIKLSIGLILTALLIMPCIIADSVYAQNTTGNRRNFKVEGGVIKERQQSEGQTDPEHDAADSLNTENLELTPLQADSLSTVELLSTADSLSTTTQTETAKSTIDINSLSKRQQKKLERKERYEDSTFVRHNKLFRDSIPISKVTARSFVIPGYAQLYNSQAWKVPILYGTVGTATYFWQKEQRTYKKYKREYNDFIRNNHFTDPGYREALDPIQKRMIKKNTTRQLYMAAALGSYIYFIAEGAVNYPGMSTDVKKATTLSTIVPGAGQIYNRSYWKAPIVLGAFATMAMTIDWNNRGYQRFKLAYDIVTTTPQGETPKDEFSGRYDANFLKKLKDNYRRNRDLCIILTGAVYLLNIIDAHVDAHMKDYDVSDDLAFNLEPTLLNFNTQSGRGGRNMLGLCFSITF